MLDPISGLLRRYRAAAQRIAGLIETLERIQGTPPAKPPAERAPEMARLEARAGDVDAVLHFQEQLGGLEGVTRVTMAGAVGGRASFIVELSDTHTSELDGPRVECSVCGKVLQEGSLPVSHGLCGDCRSEFGSQLITS